MRPAIAGPVASGIPHARSLWRHPFSPALPVQSRGWRLTAGQRTSPALGAGPAAAALPDAAASATPQPQPPGVLDAGRPSAQARQQEAQPQVQLQEQQQIAQEPVSEHAGQQAQGDQGQQQQLRHGPGLCACCRLVEDSGEPITHVITYIDGVVLEVETADGDVVYFQHDEEGGGGGVYDTERQRAAAGGPGGTASGAGGAPLVFVPDLIIPPVSPPPDFWEAE